MENSVITMRELCKFYKNQEVLHDFSLTVERGHICGLIGPNGAGKTTIMKILAGIMFQSRGELELFGSPDCLDDSRSRMSFMIEQPIISGSMTARQNLEYIRYLRGYPDEKRIDEILELVGLAGTGKKRANKFSLGMKQRLIIAQAIMEKPDILMLDEPTNALDEKGVDIVREIILREKKRGALILLASHNKEDISILTDRVYILENGRIVSDEKALMQKSRVPKGEFKI